MMDASRFSHVVLLVGCYPSRNDPAFHHEYPKDLLEYLGNDCLVILFDPVYKRCRNRLPPPVQQIDETTYKIGNNVFKIFAGLVQDYDVSQYPPGKTLLYDFTGCVSVYEIMQMCRLPPEFLDKYYIHFDVNETSSCMVSVDHLLPTTDSRNILSYLTKGGNDSTILSLNKKEVQKIVRPLAQEFSSWLRRESMSRTSNQSFYGHETYRSIIDFLPTETNYYTWFLSQMDSGENVVDRLALLYERLSPFFETIVIRQHPLSDKIHDLARAFSKLQPI